MLNFYIGAVEYGYLTFDEVPERFKADVAEELNIEYEGA